MPAATPQTILEQNKALLKRWFEEVWNQGRRETIYELFAPGGILHDGSQTMSGREAFLKFYDGMRADFSDIRVTPGICLAEGDLAALRWSVECRHKATARTVSLTGISIARIEDGCFVEAWQNWDEAALAAQIA